MKNTDYYYVYIVTNPNKTAIYIGVTNDISQRLAEHWSNRGKPETFAGKFYCYNLIYLEKFTYIQTAINRETEIKNCNRKKKNDLIKTKNPNWIFMNTEICGCWPPHEIKKILIH